MDGVHVNVGSGSQFIGLLSQLGRGLSGLAPVIPLAFREVSGQFSVIGNISN